MTLSFRTAGREDIPAIVTLLADDGLGRNREDLTDMTAYEAAFDAMSATAGNEYVLAVDGDGHILGCLQYTLIAGLSRGGTTRAQIEGVRVSSAARGQGIGEKLFRHAIERARREGATLVQLTSDLQRKDAICFYERLGFEHTHAGMKLAF